MKKLLNIVVILCVFVSLQAMKRDQPSLLPEEGEGKEETVQPPPAKKVRRGYFPQEAKSFEELTARATFKKFLTSPTIEKDLAKTNEAVRDLLKEQANDPYLLHKANSAREVENILTLNKNLNFGIDINRRNEYGETALNALIGRGVIDGAEYLLEKFDHPALTASIPDNNRVTPLQRAIKRGDVALAEAIIKLLSQGTSSINTINKKDESTAELMMYHTPLLIPLIMEPTRSPITMLKVLEERGNLQEALYIALGFGVEAVSEVIKKGADINRLFPVSTVGDGLTLLQIAILKHFDLEFIKKLIEFGADVNKQSEDGSTALMYAAKFNALAVPLLLKTDGIDVNKQGKNGATALMHAAKYNAPGVSLLLRSPGIGVNFRDNKGRTSLMLAARYNKNSVPRLLGVPGIELNAQDSNGYTALMYAAQNNPDGIPYLAATHGINLGLVNSEGKTAYDIAKENNLPEKTLKMLKPQMVMDIS